MNQSKIQNHKSKIIKILIVDDDQRMTRTLKDILTVKGYEADVARSGNEAIEKMAETHFDCLLSDIKMHGINGVELFRATKKSRPDLPVVLMTAYAHDELVKDVLEEGILAVLTKPLDINALLSFFAALRKELLQPLTKISRQELARILGQPIGKRK
ncbi:MAG: response regulator [Pseudomonadota bacterium]